MMRKKENDEKKRKKCHLIAKKKGKKWPKKEKGEKSTIDDCGGSSSSSPPQHYQYCLLCALMQVVGLSYITGGKTLHFCCHRIAKKTLHIDYSCASDAVISIGWHNCSRAHTTVQQREIKHRVSANSTTGVEAHTQSDYISAHHKSHTHSKQY